jgi:hypothetical protein
VDAVKALIPTTLLPFNIAKALMNSALVMLIYKPVSKLIRRIGLAKPSEGKGSSSRRDTVLIISIATVIFIAALVIFMILRK